MDWKGIRPALKYSMQTRPVRYDEGLAGRMLQNEKTPEFQAVLSCLFELGEFWENVRPSPRRLAGEPQTATFRPSPNTPSKASLPPRLEEEVLPMCPVQCVTYVSGRSLGAATYNARKA
jgi:hypothetical protein